MVLRGTAEDPWERGAIPPSLLNVSSWGMGTGNPEGELEILILAGKVRTLRPPQSTSPTPRLPHRRKMGLNRTVDCSQLLRQSDSGEPGGAAVQTLSFAGMGGLKGL